MKKSSALFPLLACTIICLAALLAYTPLLTNSFVGFDDNIYIYENPQVTGALTWNSIKYAFSLHHGVSYWQPLTLISLMIDHKLFGLNPVGYHLENLFIHLVNAMLIFRICLVSTRRSWPSAAIAALFALHPSTVESVAWAIERKTVLSTMFMLISILFYISYAKKPSFTGYVPVLVAMALGLMAKSMIITLPALLLIMDFWPLNRLKNENINPPPHGIAFNSPVWLVMEKIPLFLLSVLSIAISIMSLSGGAAVMNNSSPVAERIVHALVSYGQYVGRLLWPSEHAVFYPLPIKHSPGGIVIAVMVLLLISFVSCRYRRQYPWLLAGWLWYLIALFPMSGLMRAGLWPGLADRFTYIPYIGLYIMLAFSCAHAAARYSSLQNILTACGCLICAVLGYVTRVETEVWKDTVTLFSSAVRISPDSAVVHEVLGKSLIIERRQFERAETHIREALRLDPLNADAHHDLGELWLLKGRPNDALSHLKTAVLLNPKNVEFLNSLASALIETDSSSEALPLLEKALEINPKHINIRYNKGLALLKLDRKSEALAIFDSVLYEKSSFHEARINMAYILTTRGEYDKAIAEINKVLAALPDDLTALELLGSAYEMTGKYENALKIYRKLLSLKPMDKTSLTALQRLEKKL